MVQCLSHVTVYALYMFPLISGVEIFSYWYSLDMQVLRYTAVARCHLVCGCAVILCGELCELMCKVWYTNCLIMHHAMNMYWVSGGIAPCILNLGTRWRWVACFMPQSLYTHGKNSLYPLVRRLGGQPQPVWTWWQREKIPSLHCWEFNPGHLTCSLVPILIELPWLTKECYY
jgi:hypothetical protein